MRSPVAAPSLLIDGEPLQLKLRFDTHGGHSNI